jgi:hypothetical protein
MQGVAILGSAPVLQVVELLIIRSSSVLTILRSGSPVTRSLDLKQNLIRIALILALRVQHCRHSYLEPAIETVSSEVPIIDPFNHKLMVTSRVLSSWYVVGLFRGRVGEWATPRSPAPPMENYSRVLERVAERLARVFESGAFCDSTTYINCGGPYPLESYDAARPFFGGCDDLELDSRRIIGGFSIDICMTTNSKALSPNQRAVFSSSQKRSRTGIPYAGTRRPPTTVPVETPE